MKNFRITLSILIFATAAQAQFTPIDEISPSCSPTGIKEACKPDGGSFSGFPGKYTLALKIQDRVFNDKLDIEYITRHPGMLNLAEVFSGTFSSPEANILAPIRNGKLMSVPNGFEMAFDILVNENGKKYYVFFHVKGNFSNSCSSNGVAYLDLARSQVLGKFTLTKETPDCLCGIFL